MSAYRSACKFMTIFMDTLYGILRGPRIRAALWVLLWLLCPLALSACSKPVDVREYTEASLDYVFHESTGHYASIMGISQKQAEDNRREILQSQVQSQVGEADETLIQALSSMYQKALYEVHGGSASEDGSYTLELTLYPCNILKQAKNNLGQVLADIKSRPDSSSPEADDGEAYRLYTDCLLQAVETCEYSDPVSYTLTVGRNPEDGRYQISPEQMGEIESLLFPLV